MEKSSIDWVLQKLRPGQTISVELVTPAGIRTRGVTQLVGMSTGEFILIKIPTLKRNDPLVFSHSGSYVVLRWLIVEEQARVVALECPLLQSVSLPCKMLVLGMPNKMEQRELRSHLRVKTRFQVSLNWQDRSLSAVMTDLSFGGCALELANDSYQPQVGDSISLAISHPLSELLVNTVVCSSRRADNLVFLGLRFDDSPETQIKELLDYLLIDVYGLREAADVAIG